MLDTESLKLQQLNVALVPTYAITIPVIVRVGNTSAKNGFSEFKLVQSEKASGLSIRVSRDGNRSTYGDIVVTHAGSEKVVGLLRSVAVYTPNASRTISVPFTDNKVPPSGTKLHIKYQSPADDAKATLAEVDYVVP